MGQGEKLRNDEYYIQAPCLEYSNLEKAPIQSKRVRIAMVNNGDGINLCEEVFIVVCGKKTTVESLKNIALKIVEEKSRESLSLGTNFTSANFRMIKLLRSEEANESNLPSRKMQKMLSDKDLVWDAFNKRRKSITVYLTAAPTGTVTKSSLSLTTTTTTTTATTTTTTIT